MKPLRNEKFLDIGSYQFTRSSRRISLLRSEMVLLTCYYSLVDINSTIFGVFQLNKRLLCNKFHVLKTKTRQF